MAIQYIRAPFRVLDAIFPRLSARLALKLFTTPRRWPMPEWEQEIARSAQTIRLANGHTGLAWGHGEPVLLVHGWEGRVTQLGRLVAPLAARGYRVIGFNAPAHGEHKGKALNVLEYGQFLRMVVAEHGPLRGVVAHSTGASALAFAATRPLRVERAVLVSTANSVGGVVQWFEDLLGLSSTTRRVLRQRLETEIFKRPIPELDLTAHPPTYIPPTLLLATDDDRDVSASDTQSIAAHWPEARVTIVSKAGGHRKLLRDERMIEAAVNFIAEDKAQLLARPGDPLHRRFTSRA